MSDNNNSKYETTLKYVVYRLTGIMGTDNCSLVKVDFPLWYVNNGFDSEEDAIKALEDLEETYTDFVILKQVYITTNF